MNENQTNNSPATDWRDMRAQARAERRAGRAGGGWILGAIFIVAGVLLLAQNLAGFTLHNWWALFILLPAVGSFAGAWRGLEQERNPFSPAVLGPAFAGLIMLGVASAFLFELSINWSLIGPVILIVVGLSALLGGLAWRR